MTASKIVAAAASGVGGAGLDVDEVFSTFLYTGNNSSQTITNNIDLSGEGGLIWLKERKAQEGHRFIDTVRGKTKFVRPEATGGNYTLDGGFDDFTSTGFTLRTEAGWSINSNAEDMVSWTFRKARKFFDVVTYTGDGQARTINHNLGSVPGVIFIKQTNTTRDWVVYHRSLGTTKHLRLNSTSASGNDSSGEYWGGTTPTATQFSLGDYFAVNQNGGTYVAYLFAHNNNDGGFGPDGDQDIIKCGSYTGNSTDARTIDLGFEAQWLLVKRSDGATDWWIVDSMRGLHARQMSGKYLEANTSNAEASQGKFFADSQGFMVDAGDYNTTGETYIYMAIRRGPLAVPEDATKVFDLDINTQAINSSYAPPRTPFPVDMGIYRNRNQSGASTPIFARLQGANYLQTNAVDAEGSGYTTWDQMDGWGISTGSWESSSNYVFYNWKRAPSYFDVVAYSGTGSARTVSHNLGVPPEMIWVKKRDGSQAWQVYHSATGNNQTLQLNTDAAAASSTKFNSTDPTSSVFSLSNASAVNGSGTNYIAYLFATVAGISKVGSYNGNGSSQTIDCGFSVTGNINQSSQSYIFYAIA